MVSRLVFVLNLPLKDSNPLSDYLEVEEENAQERDSESKTCIYVDVEERAFVKLLFF